MRITILPCIHTDQAVGEPWDGELPIEIRSPRRLHPGEIELLIGRLYQDVADYRFELDTYKHLSPLVPLWGIVSGITVYLSLKAMFNIGAGFLLLFTWNILWLQADGIWLSLQVLLKVPQWWRARKMFKALGEAWTAKVVVDEDLQYRQAQLDLEAPERLREHKWAEHWAAGAGIERFGVLYARLLRRYPPKFMDQLPYGGGAGAWIANMVRGVPVREPWYCWPVQKEMP